MASNSSRTDFANCTPGPWTIHKDDDQPVIVGTLNGKQYFLAALHRSGPCPDCDAQLMAAAPTLLKKNKLLLDVLEKCQDKCVQYYNSNNLCDAEIHAAFGWIYDQITEVLTHHK